MVIILLWLEQNVDVCEDGMKNCVEPMSPLIWVSTLPLRSVYFDHFHNSIICQNRLFLPWRLGHRKTRLSEKILHLMNIPEHLGNQLYSDFVKYGIHREGCWWWYKTNRKVVVGIIGHSGRPTIPPPPPTQSQPPCPLNHPPPRSKTEHTASFFAGNPSHQNSFILTRISAKKKLF